ncbi:DUF4129 domain-containing protein [Candidatus Sumerlaeota bacterium]|nr:DUF4129 domain-containing protein [Candidatus Sumerlaeota bacterium]
MQRDVGFSKLLLAIFIPLCVWGLLVSLILYLIEVRSLFISGGEWRLRQALIAFSFGIILIQRIHRMLGKSTGMGYAIALGISITIFTLYMAFTYRIPASPVVVFLVNETLFLILWYAGHKITAACWLDDPVKEQTVADVGIFARIRMKKEREKEKPSQEEQERRWAVSLPRDHPGRVILLFSLFAIPAFGAGIYFFNVRDPLVSFRMGAYLFLYLWCALSLLYLASLSQLASYFEKRDVPLPEKVGIPWLATGFVIVTVILILSFFLPQPQSLPGLYVRDRLMANYRGWSSRYGIREKLGPSSSSPEGGQSGDMSSAPSDREDLGKFFDKRNEGVDKLNDPYLSEVQRGSGFEPEYKNIMTMNVAAKETFGKIFDALIVVLYILLILGGIVVLYIVVYSLGGSIGEKKQGIREKRAGEKALEKKKKPKKPKFKGKKPILVHFRRFVDPFARGDAGDGNALVRYMWEALLAFCADFGAPCEADVTPFEFVESKPEALEGFEDDAQYMARLFTFSEFSGEPVPSDELPRLQKFWAALQNHVKWMT